MASTVNAVDMLGSQANEVVLIEQPQAYITQKARVKRNRRTEWDFYVQFPGFPEDEGSWYSARAIKTQHPRGAEMIREFEHPDDAADFTPTPSAPTPQPAHQAFTQDAGPSQIGSLPMHGLNAHSQYQQPHTQDQFASQLQQPVEYKAAVPPKPGFHTNQMHGLQPPLMQDAFNTASQNDIQPALHWSFDRLQQAPQYNPAHFLPPPARPPQMPGTHVNNGPGWPLSSTAMQTRQAHALPSSMPHAALHAGMHGTAPERGQTVAAHQQQPGWEVGQQTQWKPAVQSQWQAAPGRVAGMSAQESAAAQPSTQQVVLMPSSSSHLLTQQHAGYMPPSCQYMPAQQSQHTAVQVQMQPQHDVTMRQASRQPQALPGFPSAASLRAQPEAAQRPIGLGTTPLGSHHDSAQPSRQPAAAAAAAPSSAPTATAGPPAALATAAGMIASQLPQNSTVSTPPGNATSQILGQQANHWRQATRKKGTGLLDLVPSVAKQLATKQPATASQLRSAVPGDAPVQPDTAQQDCQAFRPAVQECIAAAGLPLSKPFYQQAAEGATELCTAHTNAGRSTRVAVQHRNANSQACGAAMPDANAETDACASAHEQQGAVERQQAAQPAFGQPASPAISDDLDLGMDILLEEEQSKARRYMSATHWPSAGIAGARRVGDTLELHIKWDDGYDAWISLDALKRRQHCKSAIIDYLVSKVRKKTKG